MLIDKLIEGLTDAVGFVVGALVGYGLGESFGLEIFAEGYNTSSIVAIALIGLGGGFGLQAARHMRGKLNGGDGPPSA
jgi:hypothetical protein